VPDYAYRNHEGHERTVIMRMADVHPEAIAFNADGSWFPLVRTDADPEAFAPKAEGGGFPDGYDGLGVYRRVYGNHLINSDPVTGRYPYASNTLPQSLVDAGLAKGDKLGRPIVTSEAHAKRIAGECGFVHYD
jgi:hypothetical protein